VSRTGSLPIPYLAKAFEGRTLVCLELSLRSVLEKVGVSLVDKVSTILSDPRVYLLNQSIIGGIRARRVVVEEYVRPSPGLRVLDIGCGPAYTAAYFPTPEYYGFDISPQYIEFATRKYSSHGRFFAQLFDEAALSRVPRVDVVLMLGLLHHLDNHTAMQVLSLAKRAMQPGGRLFTVDGCYEPGQPWITRFLLDRDRGKFIRERESYVSLAGNVFGSVKAWPRNDLFHVPYSALILECMP
jgi:SAM-dependent methyltransferase